MFSIDTMSRQPIYEQLIDQLEEMVLSGLLRAGDVLPSVRSLSVELSVNPNTIQKAYTELDSRGILCAVPGRGCFVTAEAAELLARRTRQRLEELSALLHDLALAGISRREVEDRVDAVYPKEETT